MEHEVHEATVLNEYAKRENMMLPKPHYRQIMKVTGLSKGGSYAVIKRLQRRGAL